MKVSTISSFLIILVLRADFSAPFTLAVKRLMLGINSSNRDMSLFLKVGVDRSNKREDGSRHPVKTGTHTYASWKTPDLRTEDYNDDTSVNDDPEYEYDDDDAEYDDDDDSQSDVEPPSAILTWMRKLYDSMFFYGLDPAPASQRSNRRKMMRNAEKFDDKRNNSPFFTPSEQRVQRYMTSMRNQETSTENSSKEKWNDTKSKGQNFDSVKRTNIRTATSNRRRVSTVSGGSQTFENGRLGPNDVDKKSMKIRDQQLKELIPEKTSIKDLNESISDLTQELEFVDAEIMTSSENDRGYPSLLIRRNNLLDDLEDLEIELVTSKSRLL